MRNCLHYYRIIVGCVGPLEEGGKSSKLYNTLLGPIKRKYSFKWCPIDNVIISSSDLLFLILLANLVIGNLQRKWDENSVNKYINMYRETQKGKSNKYTNKISPYPSWSIMGLLGRVPV